MNNSYVVLLIALIVLTPVLAYAQNGTGSAPATGGSTQPASVASSAPAAIGTASAPAPRSTSVAPAPRPPSQPVQIQLATITTNIVVPASSPANPLPVVVAIVTVLAVVSGAFIALRGKFSKQDTNDNKCDDIRSLLEQKKKELEAFVQEWPEEKLKEAALARGVVALEKNETLAPAVEAALKAKEAYEKLQATIETLTKRYDLCMLTLPPTPNPDIEVRESKIEGKGVFALRNFTKGERVVEWGDRKPLSSEEYGKLSDDFKCRYVSEKDGKHLLSGEPMRYVNHSCEANTSPKDGADVALRDIAEGEEITSDYSHFGEENLVCTCGAKNCKGKL